METKRYNEAEAKAYILGCFKERGILRKSWTKKR
jgi:hypothetical protein